MLDRFRERFGTAGLVVAILALVVALTGGAYAASGGLTGKQKKEVKSIAKSFQGTGPAGATGAPGAKGDTGAAGSNGTNGTNGKDGTNGTNGKNAEAIPFAGSKTIGSVTCTEGGLEVKSASATTLVCNGAKGADGTNGTTGPPGPLLTTLPAGATLTGAWSVQNPSSESVTFLAAFISYPFPLATDQGPGDIEYIAEGAETGTGECPGTVAEPKAASGRLCIYTSAESGVFAFGSIPIEKRGARQSFGLEPEGSAYGTWAVTGN